MNKPILIIFEGGDKTGKSSLFKAFNKSVDYSIFTFERTVISAKVYAKIFNRHEQLIYYNEIEKRLNEQFNVLVVLCVASEIAVRQRLLEAGEILPIELDDINAVNTAFENELYNSLFNRYLLLDTTHVGIEECVDKIHRVLLNMNN